jgi:hypothetical protein
MGTGRIYEMLARDSDPPWSRMSNHDINQASEPLVYLGMEFRTWKFEVRSQASMTLQSRVHSKCLRLPFISHATSDSGSYYRFHILADMRCVHYYQLSNKQISSRSDLGHPWARLDFEYLNQSEARSLDDSAREQDFLPGWCLIDALMPNCLIPLEPLDAASQWNFVAALTFCFSDDHHLAVSAPAAPFWSIATLSFMIAHPSSCESLLSWLGVDSSSSSARKQMVCTSVYRRSQANRRPHHLQRYIPDRSTPFLN